MNLPIKNFQQPLSLIIMSLPSANFTLRFLIDANILFLNILLYGSQVKRYLVVVIFVLLGCLSVQSLQVLTISNILEIGRILPLLSLALIWRRNSTKKQIESLLRNVLFLNFVVCILNYLFISDLMVQFNFNAFSYEDANGRNTGLTASTGAIGVLAFINLFLLLKNGSKKLFGLVWLICIVGCLAFSGSKSFMAVGCLLVCVHSIGILAKSFIRPLAAFEILLYLAFVIFVIKYFIDTYDFQVLYQIVRLFSYLQATSLPSSLASRLELWDLYLSIQSQSVYYYLFGTPKELIKVHNSTFDSDIMFFIVRLGFFLTTIFYLSAFYAFIRLLQKKLFFEMTFLIGILGASAIIGIATDPQGSLFTFMVLLYIFRTESDTGVDAAYEK
jgi:hypothetical protein